MLALALPLVLTQLTQILVHTTEVLMLGRLGAAPLAAATLAAALFHTGMMFGIGVASATAPLIAQAKGARQPRQIRRVVRQGLWVTLAITLPLMAALWFARPLLSAMGQDAALLAMTEGYMRAALWGLPFSVGFIVLRSFVAAFGHARAMLVGGAGRGPGQHAAVVGADLRRPGRARHWAPWVPASASPSPSR